MIPRRVLLGGSLRRALAGYDGVAGQVADVASTIVVVGTPASRYAKCNNYADMLGDSVQSSVQSFVQSFVQAENLSLPHAVTTVAASTAGLGGYYFYARNR